MEKIRVLSDLHVDYNDDYPLELDDKDVFTVICGDTAGETEEGIRWIRKNIRRGIIINGNHMPYRNTPDRPKSEYKTMSEFRDWLKTEFPIDSDISYLDAETEHCSKVVDGILFIGSCFYTNFELREPAWNPDGNVQINMACAELNMNDYNFGYTEKKYDSIKRDFSFSKIRATDLKTWFNNAFNRIDKILTKNELSGSPLPVFLATHYPLVTDYLAHNYYLLQPLEIDRQREFSWGYYASDMLDWLKSHSSIRVVASGHIHDIEKNYRYFNVSRENAEDLLLIHNPRGYERHYQSQFFNPNLFVDVKTWTCVERGISQ